MSNIGKDQSEAPIRLADIPKLIGIIVTGSIILPILFITGLTMVPTSNASLLQNADLAYTALIAVVVVNIREGQVIIAIITVIIDGLILVYDPSVSFGLSPGSLLIILAYFC